MMKHEGLRPHWSSWEAWLTAELMEAVRYKDENGREGLGHGAGALVANLYRPADWEPFMVGPGPYMHWVYNDWSWGYDD